MTLATSSRDRLVHIFHHEENNILKCVQTLDNHSGTSSEHFSSTMKRSRERTEESVEAVHKMKEKLQEMGLVHGVLECWREFESFITVLFITSLYY